MNLAKYQALLSVVESGSLTAAAAQLGLTQSAVSHSINSLEEELGFAVIKRSRAGVKLTNEGERLLPAVRGLLNSAEQLSQVTAAIRGLDSGLVRIGTFPSVAVHWLPGVLKEFQRDYPRVEFKLLNGDYNDVEQWVRDGSVDIGFVNLPSPLDCECIPLMEDRLMAILPKDSRFASYPKFPLVECETEPFISLLKSSDHDARRSHAERPLLHEGRLRRHRDGRTGARHKHNAGAAAEGAARRSAGAAARSGSEANHRHRHRRGRKGRPRNTTLCGLRRALCKGAGVDRRAASSVNLHKVRGKDLCTKSILYFAKTFFWTFLFL